MNKEILLPTVAEFLSMTTSRPQSIGENRQRKQNPHYIHNVAAKRPSNVSRAQVRQSTCTLRLPVTLRTTRFNIQKFCIVITLHLYVSYGCQNKQ